MGLAGSQRTVAGRALALCLGMGFALAAGGAAVLGADRADSAYQRVWTTAAAQLAGAEWQPAGAYDGKALAQRVPQWRRQGVVDDLFLDGMLKAPASATDVVARKRRFLAVMVPATLLVNRLIAAERARLDVIEAKQRRGRALHRRERAWLEAAAAYYGAAPDQMALLKRRIDTVPPSLVLAQAAIESGWGRSRFAREGNALFGQYRWDGKGMIPQARPDGARHRIKQFNSPAQAILGYMHNLNTHSAYREFRGQRRMARDRGEEPSALALAAALERYSTLEGQYVRRVRLVIRQNALTDFDRARLAPAVKRRLAS